MAINAGLNAEEANVRLRRENESLCIDFVVAKEPQFWIWGRRTGNENRFVNPKEAPIEAYLISITKPNANAFTPEFTPGVRSVEELGELEGRIVEADCTIDINHRVSKLTPKVPGSYHRAPVIKLPKQILVPLMGAFGTRFDRFPILEGEQYSAAQEMIGFVRQNCYREPAKTQ